MTSIASSSPSSVRSLQPIVSVSDPRVADYRGLRDGELLRQRGLFIVEGRSNLRRLVRESPHRPRSLFLSEPASEALRDLLGELASDIPVFVASRAVLSDIAGFDIHRGCLAACERPAPVPPASLLAAPDTESLVVVLEGLANPDNVGVVFRNAQAFGADAVFLSPHCCDPFYRKAIRVSMGAALCVPSARLSAWPEALAVLRAAGYCVVALHPGDGCQPFDAATRLPRRVALMLGSEAVGLSSDALAAADRRLRIGMRAGFDSVNVATASGIALHQWFLGHRAAASQ
jgi:tRNA G18 (ribose-2'-O)-methylase SpoU